MRYRRLRYLNLLNWLIVWLPAVAYSPAMTTMPAQTDLWTLIDHLRRDIPFTKEKLTLRLGTPLNQVSENGYFTFFEGDPVRLSDGVVISKTDLRIKRHSSAHPGFLVLTLTGSCITIKEVKARYPNLELTGVPHGHSMSETVSWSSSEPWGKLSFSFPVANERCASTVVLNPKAL